MPPRFCSLVLALLCCSLHGMCQDAPSPGSSLQQHLNLAQQYIQQRRPDLAIPELEAAVAIDPANADTQANLGVLYYFGHKDAKAVPHLKAAFSAKPDLWKIEALLGLSELRLNNQDAGRADLSAALPHLKGERIQREAGDALIANYTATGELDKAAAAVAVLLDANPTDAGLLLTSYHYYSELANNAMITLALAAPNSAELHQAMARELARHGDDDAAITNYREALKINPNLPGLHLELGSMYFNSLDTRLQGQAAAEFSAAVAANPRDEKAQLMLGEDAARKGDMKAAFDAESRAVELQRDDPDACTALAKTLIEMDQPDKARDLLVHALQIDSMNETAHYRLSTLDRKQGKIDEAKKEIAEYQKYKEMKAKLRLIFREMRVKMDDKPEDESGMSK
jgi:tetratricopeptide (TPR) repeat protein